MVQRPDHRLQDRIYDDLRTMKVRKSLNSHRQLTHIHAPNLGAAPADSERLPCRLENTLFRGDRKRNPSLQQILTLQRLFEARNGEFTPEVGGGPIAMTPCLLDHKVIPSR